MLTSTLTNSVPRLLVDRNIRLSLIPGFAFIFSAILVKYSLVIGCGAGATSRLRLEDDDDDQDHDEDDDDEDDDDDDDDSYGVSHAVKEYWE